jgi:GMP synthase-like glutamine amidotransferase
VTVTENAAPRFLLISHEPEAAPAMIGEMLRDRGYRVDSHVVLGDPEDPDVAFPDPSDYDAVVAFGSFSTVYDPKARSWIESELGLIRTMVHHDIPYLGVCFGGQLLAESLGGHVERAPDSEQEIGIVTFDDDPALPVPPGPWFTWHEDRVVVPDDVEVLAHNGKAVQVFRRGRAVGIQFHPEANIGVVGDWVRIGPDHIPEYTSAGELLQDLAVNEETLRRNCEALVDWFVHEVAGLES